MIAREEDGTYYHTCAGTEQNRTRIEYVPSSDPRIKGWIIDFFLGISYIDKCPFCDFVLHMPEIYLPYMKSEMDK